MIYTQHVIRDPIFCKYGKTIFIFEKTDHRFIYIICVQPYKNL